MRLSFLFSLLLMLVLGSAVFAVANKVQEATRLQNQIEAKIADEQEGLRVLHAEWAFLTNPNRLQKLAVEHFGLAPSEGTQYVEVAAIPMRDFMDQQQPVTEQIATAEQVKPQAKIVAQPDPTVAMTKPAALPAALPAPAAHLPTLQATPVNAVTGAADE